MSKFSSARGGVLDALEFNVDPSEPNVTVGLKFFDALNQQQFGVTGSVQISGLINGGTHFIEFNGSPLDLSDPSAFASAKSPLEKIRAVPTGISGAEYYQITVSQTE
jgi:hypothetical protein